LTLKLALQAESIFPPGVSALYTKILTPVARLYQQKYLNTTAVTSYFLSKNCAVVFAKNTTAVTSYFLSKNCAVVFAKNTTAVTSYFLNETALSYFSKNATTVTPNFPYKICAVVFEIISPVILTSNCAFLTTSPMSAPVWRARKWHTHNDIYPLP
jgi:hypothetical protein